MYIAPIRRFSYLLLMCVASVCFGQLYKLQHKGDCMLGTPPIAENNFQGVHVLPDGHFLVWGNRIRENVTSGFLAWYSRTGTLVRTSHVQSLFPEPFDSVAVDSEGSIIILTSWTESSTSALVHKVSMAIDRFESDGSPLPTYAYISSNRLNSNAFTVDSVSGNVYAFASSSAGLHRVTVSNTLSASGPYMPAGFAGVFPSDAIVDPVSNFPVLVGRSELNNGNHVPFAMTFNNQVGSIP